MFFISLLLLPLRYLNYKSFSSYVVIIIYDLKQGIIQFKVAFNHRLNY